MMVGGRRKRRRVWTASSNARRLLNAVDLWPIAEEDEEDARVADARTIVFGSAQGGLDFGYVGVVITFFYCYLFHHLTGPSMIGMC